MKKNLLSPFHRVLFLSVFLLVLSLFPGMSGKVYGQKKQNFLVRYLNYALNDTAENSKPKFMIYPTLGYAPETSWEFGLSTLLLYYARQDTTNRLSEVSGFSFITLEKQYGFWFDHALYSHENDWFFLGRARYQHYPLFYHGIGAETPSEHTALVDANYLWFKERVLRKVYKGLYLGAEIDYQSLFRVNFLPAEGVQQLPLPLGWEGSQNLSLGAGVIWDTRHNVLNVRKAEFSELAILHSNRFWGSDYSFTSLLWDNRFYRPVNDRDVLAVQMLGQFTFGDVPFHQLSLMGGESLMRGYYLGRYRDKHQLAGQVEYRFLPFKPFKRWGAALFCGTGTVFSEQNPLQLSNFVLAGGGGVRFLIFPKKDIFTRLDVAFTKEGPGYYIFIGEAF